MNKNVKTLLKILLIFVIVISTLNTTSHASFWSDIFGSAKNFESASNTVDISNNAQMNEVRDTLYTVLFYVGVAVVVIWGGILGIKFMTASVEDKAKVKESLIPYLLGSVIIFGAFGIWRLVIVIMTNAVK